jgi:hypothetical protein
MPACAGMTRWASPTSHPIGPLVLYKPARSSPLVKSPLKAAHLTAPELTGMRLGHPEVAQPVNVLR